MARRRESMADPFAGYSDQQMSEVIARAIMRWEQRWLVIRGWRDLRYGRDDVLSTIPENLRATSYEYHAPDYNNSVLGFANFASAGAMRITVTPPSDQSRTKAEDAAAVLLEVMRPGGVLDVEQDDDVPYGVWENQSENGQGIYKVMLKRDYPLAIPTRNYADNNLNGQADGGVEYEDNPFYEPRTRIAGRADRGATRYRESDKSYSARRDKYFEEDFPFEWRLTDPDGHFIVEQDGQVVMEGEITLRPTAVCNDHGVPELRSDKRYMVQAGLPTPAGANTPQRGDYAMISCVEAWTRSFGMFGFVTNAADGSGLRGITFSKDARYQRWPHQYGRVPYFHAYGPRTTDPDLGYRWSGAFDGMLAETPLVNNLETQHFNSVHRSRFPRYQLVRSASSQASPPLDVAQTAVFSYEEAQGTQPPPGYEYQPIPPGAMDDLLGQLQMARGRLNDNALAQVLRGITAPGDSGAKVSFTINAAGRALDPFKRRHEGCLAEVAVHILRTAKRLKLDLNVNTIATNPGSGRTFARAITLKWEDIVSESVRVTLDLRLPVDQGAMETRGLTLERERKMSYEHAAPEFYGVADPHHERELIDFEQRQPQLDELAFRKALQTWATLHVDADTMQILGEVPAPQQAAGGVGGGPRGAYGGASRALGRGDASTYGSPGGPQVDVGH